MVCCSAARAHKLRICFGIVLVIRCQQCLAHPKGDRINTLARRDTLIQLVTKSKTNIDAEMPISLVRWPCEIVGIIFERGTVLLVMRCVFSRTRLLARPSRPPDLLHLQVREGS